MSTPVDPRGGTTRAAIPWMSYGQSRNVSSGNGTTSQAGVAVIGGVPHHLAALQQAAHRSLGGQSGNLPEKGRAPTGLSGIGRGEALPVASGVGPRGPVGQATLKNDAQGQRDILDRKPLKASAGGGGPITKQQLTVLRAQILVFRKMKKGELVRREDILQQITPEPLLQPHLANFRTAPLSGFVADQGKPSGRESEVGNQKPEKETGKPNSGPVSIDPPKVVEPVRALSAPAAVKDGRTDEQKRVAKEEDRKKRRKEMRRAKVAALRSEADRGVPTPSVPQEAEGRGGRGVARYEGPLFGLPPLSLAGRNVVGESLGFSAAEVLAEECGRLLKRRRESEVAEVGRTLEVRQGGQRRKLQIRHKLLHCLTLQSALRAEVEADAGAIAAMGERSYRTFLKWADKQKAEIAKQSVAAHRAGRERFLKALFGQRKSRMEAQWAGREGRGARNRGVIRCHEKMQRDAAKKKDEDHTKRMEALKNCDVDAYRAILEEQQESMVPGDAKERFEVLTSFLSQTEEYLKKLGGKISAVKNQQETEEAALTAASNARARGCSEEEVSDAAREAVEALSGKDALWEMGSEAKGAACVSRYYSLAHSVREVVVRQPSQLRAGTLRDYQLVGLQWMLSLYNNRLNGILADEMGLGKTVQVMALIAYLMEFKGNNGPHLIIVPNAVMVNWKSELRLWVPHVACVYYCGNKEERARLYAQEVAARKFNVLLTTYEFIMRDKARLSKVEWKYLVIDEAQRMKDRESKLARDLDKYRCQRRLLLTGTPLQNDLNELWSLLNLLLPEVFDNSRAFNDWFATPFASAKEGPGAGRQEADWLETEKKVIVIHRLHQILEPFMLRRRVEDVEGSLPPKIAVVLKCQMSSYQAAVYDWVRATGTLRLDPDTEAQRVAGTQRTHRAYAPLQNRCMELRKVCNHPYLTYPPAFTCASEEVVRCCGKLVVLDRILMKLKRTGHRVLLFCTMTRLLDVLEEYLAWRRLTFRRIDGTTPLDGREAAIDDFNRKDSPIFLFLLSIRAAGRGLNLQTADTVVIYDPDPNPKNEEQAIARAHRIGQKKEVRVVYLEAVGEAQPFFKKEDRERRGAAREEWSSGEEGEGRREAFVGSIETLVRNNIQQHKIEMADEVINAGRFDQHTTQEERRQTLEALLKDEMRNQQSVGGVPSLKEVNRMMARGEEEEALFNAMDEEEEWPARMADRADVPDWLCCGSAEVEGAKNSTLKPSLRSKAVGPGGGGGEERGRGVRGMKAEAAKSRAAEEERARVGQAEEGWEEEAGEGRVAEEEEEEAEEEDLWRKADVAEAEEGAGKEDVEEGAAMEMAEEAEEGEIVGEAPAEGKERKRKRSSRHKRHKHMEGAEGVARGAPDSAPQVKRQRSGSVAGKRHKPPSHLPAQGWGTRLVEARHCGALLRTLCAAVGPTGRPIGRLLTEIPVEALPRPELQMGAIQRRVEGGGFEASMAFAECVADLLAAVRAAHRHRPEVSEDARQLGAIFVEEMGRAFPTLECAHLVAAEARGVHKHKRRMREEERGRSWDRAAEGWQRPRTDTGKRKSVGQRAPL